MTDAESRHWCYQLSGLALASVLRLPELPETPSPPPKADVVLQRGDTGTPAVSHFQLNGGGADIELRVPGLGVFQVSGGSRMTVCPAAEAAAEDVRAVVLGPLWAAVCYQRRRLLLHAAACRNEDRIILLCGRSGSGKSTLLAALAREGCMPLSDDTCVVALQAGAPPLIHPGIPRLKLWPEALTRLGIDPARTAPVMAAMDKRQFPWPYSAPPASPAVVAAYLLEWGDPAVEPLHGLEAAKELAAAGMYCPWLLERIMPLAEHWSVLIELLRTMPLFRFRRPRDWDFLPAAVALLTGHVTALS